MYFVQISYVKDSEVVLKKIPFKELKGLVHELEAIKGEGGQDFYLIKTDYAEPDFESILAKYF